MISGREYYFCVCKGGYTRRGKKCGPIHGSSRVEVARAKRSITEVRRRCGEHGTVIVLGGFASCYCDEGYRLESAIGQCNPIREMSTTRETAKTLGLSTTVPTPASIENNANKCKENGVWMNIGGFTQCICDEGYQLELGSFGHCIPTGEVATTRGTAKPPTDLTIATRRCVAHAHQVFNGPLPYCRCDVGYRRHVFGPCLAIATTQTPLTTTIREDSPCGDNGKLIHVDEKPYCSCRFGYFGDKCQYVDQCVSGEHVEPCLDQTIN